MKRVAVVTGGTRGIGAAIAKALKKDGYFVAANYEKIINAIEAPLSIEHFAISVIRHETRESIEIDKLLEVIKLKKFH